MAAMCLPMIAHRRHLANTIVFSGSAIFAQVTEDCRRALCRSLASAQIALKVCQSQPQTMYSECSRFHPNRFTMGGIIAERMNTVETRTKVFPIFDTRQKPSFEPNKDSNCSKSSDSGRDFIPYLG